MNPHPRQQEVIHPEIVPDPIFGNDEDLVRLVGDAALLYLGEPPHPGCSRPDALDLIPGNRKT